MDQRLVATLKALAGEVLEFKPKKKSKEQTKVDLDDRSDMLGIMDGTLSTLDEIRDSIKELGWARELGNYGAPKAQKAAEDLEKAEQNLRKHILDIRKKIAK